MKLPPLQSYFPVHEAMANLYGGWLEGPYFKRLFRAKSTKTQLKKLNDFLKENEFDIELSEADFNNELSTYENQSLTCTYNILGDDCVLLIYEQPLMSNPIESLQKLITNFRDERDWQQFHTPKNLSMAISSEAGELLDQFIWDRDVNADIEKVSDEIADIFNYLLLISEAMKIDLFEVTINKLLKNEAKYPVKSSKGNAKKYNKL